MAGKCEPTIPSGSAGLSRLRKPWLSLVRVEYSYNDTHMYQSMGDEILSAEINDEQLSHLNSLHANDQMTTAHIFADAYGPVCPATEAGAIDRDYKDDGDR